MKTLLNLDRLDLAARYCDEIRNELPAQSAGWLVRQEMASRVNETGDIRLRTVTACWFDTEAEANAAVGSRLMGEAARSNHLIPDCWMTRVWVERESN